MSWTPLVTKTMTMEHSSSEEESALESKELVHGEIIVGTAFDAYFSQISATPRTSSSVFSDLVQPLTSDEYLEALRSPGSGHVFQPKQPSNWANDHHQSSFDRFARELDEGFNLIFYGVGSKRVILNTFASEICSRKGHVVIANSFQPTFSLKNFLTSIECVPGIQNLPLSSAGIERQAQRIFHFFGTHPQNHQLYLFVHNIDAPIFRATKAKSCLSLLALNPNIHLIASIDRVNASLLWSSSELSIRKQLLGLGIDKLHKGYAWLWHDLTTLVPYDVELAHADRSSISGATGSAARNQQESAVGSVIAVTETAAQHILASVTQKAKRLFALLTARQLEIMDEASDAAGTNPQQHALPYEWLFNAARDKFIATNDTAMRSLLGEFKDHALILSAPQGGPGSAEVLWIPLQKDKLLKIVKSLDIEQ